MLLLLLFVDLYQEGKGTEFRGPEVVLEVSVNANGAGEGFVGAGPDGKDADEGIMSL